MKALRAEPFKTKFQVFDRGTGKFVPDCFLMFPASDPAAIPAMKAYLSALPGNDPDRQALSDWIDHLEHIQGEYKEMEKYDGNTDTRC